ncbi:TetR/AcrR family transcriptional regulator [Nonomuraea sp. NBC_01738]|uniref:TetR/AcrR family transcriptional regulator n=1 Tax=Nonomuraea sp. NBC_01738 TaxID=2976003 RepID=UPI002E1477BB|nr:TetR/AcrR family transcriptional regulator [Nonomuraea sp. NBC_01738]
MARADAERNIAAILAAGQRLLSADPTASVAEIAKAAGVGRVTLYGHFPSREDLVDAVLRQAIDQAQQVLDQLELDEGPAPQALTTLVATAWEVLDRHSRLFVAADRAMGTTAVRERHAGPLLLVERLIARGRAEGDFRTDLPLPWLVSTFFAILHTMAQEVESARLDRAEASGVLVTTLESLLSARSRRAG